MRFFEFQDNARGQTRRLLFWFALMVLLLVLAINAALALAWAVTGGLAGWDFPRYFFQVNTAVTLLFVLGGWWLETSSLRGRGAGVALARQLGAREAQPSGQPAEQRLLNIVQEMALAASMRAPEVMVVAREHGINAFATGWDETDAVVAVTQGALERLDREEMQGLVAHEMSHIREGDTRLNMRLVGMVFGLEMIHRLGAWLWAPDEKGQRHVGALFGLAIMAVGWLGWLAGHALQAAVTRQREFLADARAVQWTRNRESLGRVLRKVWAEADAARRDRALARARAVSGVADLQNPVLQHLLLVQAEGGMVSRWFDSHPPLPERVRRIYGRSMSPLVEEAVAEPGAEAGAEPGASFGTSSADAAPAPRREAPLHVGLRH